MDRENAQGTREKFPEPRRKLGLGIFPSPSAYIEGKRSEFFSVPGPI